MEEEFESNAIRVFNPQIHRVRVGDIKSVVYIKGGQEAKVVPAAVMGVGDRGFYCENSRLGLREIHIFGRNLRGQLFREYQDGNVLVSYANKNDVDFWLNAAKTMPKNPSTRICLFDGSDDSLSLDQKLDKLVGIKNVIRVFNSDNPDVNVGDVYLVPCIGNGPAKAVPTVVVAVGKRGFDYENKQLGIVDTSQSFRDYLKGFLFREYQRGKVLSAQASRENVEDYRICLKTKPLEELPFSIA